MSPLLTRFQRLLDRVAPFTPPRGPERLRVRFTAGVAVVLGPLIGAAIVLDVIQGFAMGMAAQLFLLTMLIGVLIALNRGLHQLSRGLLVGGVLVVSYTALLLTGGAVGGLSALALVGVALAAVLLPRPWAVATTVLLVAAAMGEAALAPDLDLFIPSTMHFLVWVASLALVGTIVAAVTHLNEAMSVTALDRERSLRRALNEIKQTAVSRDYLQGLLGGLREFIVVTDLEHRIQWVNAAVNQSAGWSSDELHLAPLHTLFGPIDPGREHWREVKLHRQDGTQVPVALSRGQLTHATGAQLVWAATDTSSEHAAMEALSHANQRVRAANVAKSNFLANMSHELRTPLNAIIGYTELLSDELHDESHLTDLDRVGDAAHTLLGLINGVLDLSKVEAGKMDAELQVVALHELVEPVSSMIELLAARSVLAFDVVLSTGLDLDQPVHTDPIKLRQVLTNLLSNAVKFTDTGTVTLTIESWRRGSLPWLRFVVEDSGIGMNAEQLEHVFEPFAQAHSGSDTKHRGTGLGLSISRAFVEMLGGQIYATSTPGQGTRFVVEVPASRSARAAPMATPGRTPLPAAIETDERVLVVDDDESYLEFMERILARPGRQVVATNDPRGALEWARHYRADLILLDIEMPALSGWSFLVRIRDTACADTPVVVVSGEADQEVATALGARSFLTKPASTAEIHDCVAQFLNA